MCDNLCVKDLCVKGFLCVRVCETIAGDTDVSLCVSVCVCASVWERVCVCVKEFCGSLCV